MKKINFSMKDFKIDDIKEFVENQGLKLEKRTNNKKTNIEVDEQLLNIAMDLEVLTVEEFNRFINNKIDNMEIIKQMERISLHKWNNDIFDIKKLSFNFDKKLEVKFDQNNMYEIINENSNTPNKLQIM